MIPTSKIITDRIEQDGPMSHDDIEQVSRSRGVPRADVRRFAEAYARLTRRDALATREQAEELRIFAEDIDRPVDHDRVRNRTEPPAAIRDRYVRA